MSRALPEDFIEMVERGDKFKVDTLGTVHFAKYVFGKLDQLNEGVFNKSLSCCLKDSPVEEEVTIVEIKKECLWNRFLEWPKYRS